MIQSRILRYGVKRLMKGGGTPWVAISALGLVFEGAKRVRRRNSTTLAVETLQPGDHIEVVAIEPTTKRQRKLASKQTHG